MMNRRDLILSGAATGFLALSPSPVFAAAEKKADAKFLYEIGRTRDLKFTLLQQERIRQSMRLIEERFLNTVLLQKVFDNTQRYLRVLWPGRTATQLRGLISSQFHGLRNTRQIPMFISPYINENVNVGGRAYAKEGIKTVQNNGKPTSQGSISIELNTKTWAFGNRDVLAGVIAHEMLHQMGHTHQRGIYDDENFITIFGDMLMSNGTYHSRSKSKSFSLKGGASGHFLQCGCKQAGF